MDKDYALEELMGKLGDFGKYQCFQFLLHILAAMTAGMHMLSLVTVGAVPEHRCHIPGVDTHNTTANWYSEEVLSAIPLNEFGVLESCKVKHFNTSVYCDDWVYNTTYHKLTKAMEWDFVCSRKWMGAVPQTLYMIGVLIGSIALGKLSDKFGRKTTFMGAAIMQVILGISAAFAPQYASFVAVRFLFGIFGSGSYLSGFVITMELVGPTKRTICGVAFQVCFAIGIMLVAAWGYIVSDIFLLQIVYALHSCLLLPHWFIMDESPRWLWVQGRKKESLSIIQKALKFNGSRERLDVASLISQSKMEKKSEMTSAGVLDLFKSPNLMRKTLIVCFCWFANSVVYYGLSLNTRQMEGNPFLIIFLLGLVELPSYVMIVVGLDRFGHRILINAMLLAGGGACLVVTLLPGGSSASTIAVMIGKLFISGSFSIIYKYSAELFPTVVRSSAVGLGNMCASIAGAFTPLIGLLDSFDPRIPTILFGLVAIASGIFNFFLPETLNRDLPQSLEDGERFGLGETCFTNCSGKPAAEDSDDEDPEAMEAVLKKTSES